MTLNIEVGAPKAVVMVNMATKPAGAQYPNALTESLNAAVGTLFAQTINRALEPAIKAQTSMILLRLDIRQVCDLKNMPSLDI
jgi:hypothetical protein